LQNVFLGYVYGFIAVLIVSALSLVGLLTLPILYKISFKYVLKLFTAIAIGTLFGDAMFHLIPSVCFIKIAFKKKTTESFLIRSLVFTVTIIMIIIMDIHHFRFLVINGKFY
jgi:hypothetical protein